jgi:hypothetical protein
MSASIPPEDPAQKPPSTNDDPAFGWTSYAERINGRFATVGLVSLLILEAVTGQGFLTWLGLR